MRIRSNIVPTPIVSFQPGVADTRPVVAPPPIHVDTEPLVVDLGNKKLELQPGELAKVVDQMNQTARVFNQTLQFAMNQDSRHIVIRVIDTVSGEVLREIPPEKMMAAAASMEAVLGLLLDRKL
jgi:flagellar protein FlaG